MSSRKSYRNKMVRKGALQVTFVSPDGQATEGSLLDVHGEGAAASFPDTKGVPRIRRGDAGTLRFSASDAEEEFTLEVEVRSAREVKGGVRVGFAFDSERPFEIKWPDSLRSLFNRRGAYRVRPRADEEMRVIVKADSEEVGSPSTIRGVLMDISLTGARIKMPEPLSWPTRALKVRVTFVLPETQLRVMVGAVLRNTYADASHVGLEFETDASRRFGINQKEIREYIMQRQREDLRRMSWLSGR